MCGSSPGQFLLLLFCEEVGRYRNVELARWALMDVPEVQVPKKVGNDQKDGPSLRKSALLGRATRGHPGNMTGDKNNAAQPDRTSVPFLLRVKSLRNDRSGELGKHGGVKSPQFTN